MSLKYVATRLVRNAVSLVLGRVGAGGGLAIKNGGVARRALRSPRVEQFASGSGPAAPRRPPLSLGFWGGRARIFFDTAFAKVVPVDLRRRITNRLFHGNSITLFSLIGLSLSSESTLLTKDDEQDVIWWNIKEVVSKFPFDFYYYENEMINTIKLDDLCIGKPIAKGSCAMVYSAKLKNATENVEVPSSSAVEPIQEPIEYPLALKIMFNYDIQSNSMAILNAMHHETLPALSRHINTDIFYWENNLNKQKVVLPPHPNLVVMYSAFADYMPNLNDSMDNYPDALPLAYNPEGLGRNMTLFLLMKKYKYSLIDYLKKEQIEQYDSLSLFAQLLEAIAHINRHGIAHRDLKSDNILIEEIGSKNGNSTPLLVISDFGCCLANKECGLKLPYTSDYVNKGGNTNLMAPEIILQQPGVFSFLDYTKSDLWAAGAIAYEIFGLENPFSSLTRNKGNKLSNVNYTDSQIPAMNATVPFIIQQLVKNILSKNPKNRLQPEVAANVCQLYLWAPSSWITSKKLPSNEQILQWLMRLAVKLICEGQLSNNDSDLKNNNPEYYLITSFLLRVKFSFIKKALWWIQTNNNQ
ncbi:PTEN-induced putative kinase 1 [Arctopsyche grandis]|uniref:PTEN-induced putative kinase 1 n=1 Tax=Arctopsyche grandis TaxID=121162 RepID=UPI00406D94EA